MTGPNRKCLRHEALAGQLALALSEGAGASEEVTQVAVSTAQALSAVHRILQRLLGEAHLAEDERQSYAKDLEWIDHQVQWMVDDDTSLLRRPD
jgi:hypothetical protein